MKPICFALLAILCLNIHAAIAQVGSNGASIEITATYSVQGSDIGGNDVKVLSGPSIPLTTATASPNFAYGHADTTGVSMTGFAASISGVNPFDISQSGGVVTSIIRNVSGGPVVVSGWYAILGNAWMSAPFGASGGIGNFSLVLQDNDPMTMRVFAGADGRFPSQRNSSAAIDIEVHSANDPIPPRKGSTPEKPKPFTECDCGGGADLSQQHSAGDDSYDGYMRPVQVAGINLLPIIDDYGQTSPVYLGGGNSDPPAAALSSLEANDSFAAMSSYVVSDIQYAALDNRFTHFTLPYAIGGDTDFMIRYAGQEYPYQAGTLFDFTTLDPTGVASFFLRGIDPGAVNSDADFVAIVSGMQFANSGATQVYTIGGVMVVPEPACLGLFASAALFATFWRPKQAA